MGAEIMAPAWGFFSWWGREDGHRKGNLVVVTMESPNFSVVEIEGPDEAFRPVEKSRNKNAKQVTWVLLLKANRAVECVAWLAGAMWALLEAVHKRLIFGEGVAVDNEKLGKGRVLFQVIQGFLVASLIILGFEVMAYTKGWHYFDHTNLRIPSTSDVHSLLRRFGNYCNDEKTKMDGRNITRLRWKKKVEFVNHVRKKLTPLGAGLTDDTIDAK